MNDRTKTVISAITAITIALVVCFSGMQTSTDKAYAQIPYNYGPSQNTTTVTGTATATAVPDLAVIQLGADTQAKTAQEALAENAQIINSTATAIQKLGITSDEIGTSNFQIQPVYNNTVPYPQYGGYNNQLLGYRVSNTLVIKTGNMSLTGKILDTAVSEGANRVDGVWFTLSPSTLQSEQNNLIVDAVQDAQAKAQKALTPLGEKIIGVKSVNLAEIRVPQPMPQFSYKAMMASPASAVQTPIFASNQEITTSVDVIFLIGAR